MIKRIVDVAAHKAEVNFMEMAFAQLRQIFPLVEKEREFKTENVPSMIVDVAATSANGQLILFELKNISSKSALGYSVYASVAALKDSVKDISPDSPPIVSILTNGRVDEPIRSLLVQSGIPIVTLLTRVAETKANLHDAFERCAIKLPEFVAEDKGLAFRQEDNYRSAIPSQIEEIRQSRKDVQQASNFADIIGQSPGMKQIFAIMNGVLDSDATVLIQGESGTGKELVARALHYYGVRKEKPFVALFCGSLPESLLESELFGHTKGSFTGAISDKKGLFETADTGTFFLDEIGDITPKLQTQLLRLLQEGEIKRVGENHVRHVDVRIIAATNKNLQEKIETGEFREDLYYRLNVINIYMPPLRERTEDILLLAQHFLMRFGAKYKKDILSFSAKAVDRLTRYHWPGNVRELEKTIERAVELAKGALIGPEDLQLSELGSFGMESSDMTLEQLARRLVEQTLKETGGNITRAAERLGVSRPWIQYKQKMAP